MDASSFGQGPAARRSKHGEAMSRAPKRRNWNASTGPGWLWRASVLVVLSTLLGLAAVSAAMVVINIPLPHRAEASQQYGGP